MQPLETAQTLAFEAFELDLEHQDLRLDGSAAPLHATPFRLLSYLVRHRGRAVSKRELLEHVWPDAVVSDAALSSALKELRRALGDDGATQRFISTQRGRGYRWIAPVEVRSAAALAATARIARLPAPAPRARRLAVLPFKNLSANPDDSYFTDGVTEDIVAQVSKVRGLSVVSSTSSSRFHASTKSLGEIAAELAVGFVVEGSVRREGRRVRIVSQLIDASSDTHLWSETYDREVEDIFAIQQDVAERIAAALRAELSDSEQSELERRPTQELLAYDFYLQGRQHYRRWQREENERAVAAYRNALEIDPKFALAWAGLANALGLRGTNFHFRDAADEALAAARRALTLEPSLAEAHKAVGLAHSAKGELRAALAATLRALELWPDYDEAAFNAAGLLSMLGRWDEALSRRKHAILLRAQPPHCAPSAYAMSLLDLGFAAESKAWAERALAFDPLLPELRERLAEEALMDGDLAAARTQLDAVRSAGLEQVSWRETAGWIEFRANDCERAAEHFRAAAAADGGGASWPQLGLAACARASGKPAKCARLLAEVVPSIHAAIDRGDERPSQPRALAVAAALRGDPDEALAWLEKAIDAGWRHYRWDACEPAFEEMRETSRFVALDQRMRLAVAKMRERAERMAWHRPEAPERTTQEPSESRA